MLRIRISLISVYHYSKTLKTIVYLAMNLYLISNEEKSECCLCEKRRLFTLFI